MFTTQSGQHTITQQRNLPPWLQGPLQQATGGAQDYFQGFQSDPNTLAGLGGMTNVAQNPDQFGYGSTLANFNDLMSGAHLYGGPGFNAAMDAAQSQIQPRVQSAFNRSGRLNSGLAPAAMTEELGDVFAGLYGQERNRQMRGLQLAPQMQNFALGPSQTLYNVGQLSDQETESNLNDYISRLQGIGDVAGYSQTESSPLYENQLAEMLGLGLTGAGLAQTLFGGGGGGGMAAGGGGGLLGGGGGGGLFGSIGDFFGGGGDEAATSAGAGDLAGQVAIDNSMGAPGGIAGFFGGGGAPPGTGTALNALAGGGGGSAASGLASGFFGPSRAIEAGTGLAAQGAGTTGMAAGGGTTGGLGGFASTAIPLAMAALPAMGIASKIFSNDPSPSDMRASHEQALNEFKSQPTMNYNGIPVRNVGGRLAATGDVWTPPNLPDEIKEEFADRPDMIWDVQNPGATLNLVTDHRGGDPAGWRDPSWMQVVADARRRTNDPVTGIQARNALGLDMWGIPQGE